MNASSAQWLCVRIPFVLGSVQLRAFTSVQRYFSPHSFSSSAVCSSVRCPIICVAHLSAQLIPGFSLSPPPRPPPPPPLFSPSLCFAPPTLTSSPSANFRFLALASLLTLLPLPGLYPAILSSPLPSFLPPPPLPLPACQCSSHHPSSPSDDCQAHFIWHEDKGPGKHVVSRQVLL